MTLEGQLEKLIFSRFGDSDRWEGTARELYAYLDESPGHHQAFRDLVKSEDALGKRLAVLCEKSPAHFSLAKRTSRRRVYAVTPPRNVPAGEASDI